MNRVYKTSQIAKKTGVNSETLRFYMKRGLIPEPIRTDSGYRQYPEDTIHRIHFIKNAQRLGFTLQEIKEMLNLSLETKGKCQNMKGEIDKKISDIQERIKHLKWIHEALKKLHKLCEKGGSDEHCPILTYLYKEV